MSSNGNGAVHQPDGASASAHAEGSASPTPPGRASSIASPSATLAESIDAAFASRRTASSPFDSPPAPAPASGPAPAFKTPRTSFSSSAPSPLHRVLSAGLDGLPRIPQGTSGDASPAAAAAMNGGGSLGAQKRRKSRVLDGKDKLKKEEDGVVKRRDGGVLARGFILKTDHYPTGRALDLDIHLEGAPNWRAPNEDSLNVYGCAQPTLSGLRSILALLGCRISPGQEQGAVDGGGEQNRCVWFCTREEPIIYISGKPFVLRDGSSPKTTLALSDRAENLEGIESRLKADILRESQKYGGLIMTHEELEGGHLMRMWTAVDERNLLTVKEAWDQAKQDGWAIDFHRIPISAERPIEDNYLDAYIKILRAHDPLTTALVFNDGMGAVRATFAMCAAAIVRRKQFLDLELDEPFSTVTGTSTPIQGMQATQFFKQTAQQQTQNRALLRLTHLMERLLQATDVKTATSATELLARNMTLLESLRNAIMGNYQVILSLLSFLDKGKETKTLVDKVIDSCDAVVNLRDEIIRSRLQYSLITETQAGRQVWLEKALFAMEKYFFLIAFASYVEEEDAGARGRDFASWLQLRPEIWNMIKVMRRRGGGRLFIFTPINDLTQLARVSTKQNTDMTNASEAQEPDVLDDEFSLQVVSQRAGIILRPGTVLKSDRWQALPSPGPGAIRGAPNLRRIPGESVWTLGQPSADAITAVVRKIQKHQTAIRKVLWLNLREEPVVMIVGEPYCLRKANMTLRNLKDYNGVSGSRLETLEERLVSDATAELKTFDSRLLLHTETQQGSVAPHWEQVHEDELKSPRTVMEIARSSLTDIELSYRRLPITAQSLLDLEDISDLLRFCMRNDSTNTAIILNDQLGRGRATLASIAICLIYRWIRRDRQPTANEPAQVQRSSWQLVNSCLRTLPNGIGIKRAVDDTIDLCSNTFHLRDSIEVAYQQADEAKTDSSKKNAIKDGKTQLARYLQLIQLQAYMDSQSIESETTFADWCKERPVLQTFTKELHEGGLEVLAPVGPDAEGGLASSDEVKSVIFNRSGSILSSGCIIKVDLFLGLQKQSLPDRVDGAANYRQVPLVLDDDDRSFVYGTGMPTCAGLRNALERMGAARGGPKRIVWTSLREEPVLYIKGRPHVLRLVDAPIKNIESTGIDATVVESMESALQRDIMDEMQRNGRILLHDEVEISAGHFDLAPIWDKVSENDLQTPKQLYEQVVSEGYQVRYNRIAITDEQAPLPAALNAMVRIVEEGLKRDHTDFTFNCQMGRGRTTSGMILANITASIVSDVDHYTDKQDTYVSNQDDVSEERAYLNGEYKMILQLVSVLAHGKEAKALVDRSVDSMAGVQNLREAVYDFKLRIDAAEPGSRKWKEMTRMGLNYAFRYGMFIVLADYLLEQKRLEGRAMPPFDLWFEGRREIRSILSRKTLD